MTSRLLKYILKLINSSTKSLRTPFSRIDKKFFTLAAITSISIYFQLQSGYVNAMSEPFNSPKLEIEVSAANEERVKLQEIVDTVDKMFSSKKLWHDFEVVSAQYPQIFIGPDYQQKNLPTGMADSFGAASVLQNSYGKYHVFQSIFGVTGTYYPKGRDYVGKCYNPEKKEIQCYGTEFGQNYSNKLVVTHGIGLILPDKRELVSIEIGREILKRYNSPSIIKKSCMYNTLAHEWTHTIGKDETDLSSIVVDSDRRVPVKAVKLSYLFGSVAQCSWLQSQGEIGSQEKDLKSCVQRFGVDQFLSLQCDD